jgi:hypothetical protein
MNKYILYLYQPREYGELIDEGEHEYWKPSQLISVTIVIQEVW